MPVIKHPPLAPAVGPFLEFSILEGLLSPFGVKAFLEDYWEKRCLLVRGSGPARAGLQVPDWEAIARPAFEKDKTLVEVLSTPSVKDIQDFAQVQEAFANGISIRIVDAQRSFAPLKTLCGGLSLELSHPVRANVYITPPGRQGLDPHVDDHDVLVVQMAGRKGWKLFDTPYELPLEHAFPLFFEMGNRSRAHSTWSGTAWGARSFRGQSLGPPDFDGAIENGELIYVPRGVLHVASSLEQASVHATLGIHATRIADLAVIAVDRVARGDVELRRSLPLGFARYFKSLPEVTSRIEEAIKAIKPEDLHDAWEEIGARLLVRHREVFETTTPPGAKSSGGEPSASPASAMPEATIEPAITVLPLDSTRFRLFPDVQISDRAERVNLRRFGKGPHNVEFPAAFAGAVIEIASRNEFQLDDLKTLSPRSTQTLLTHLIEKGLVEQLPNPPRATPG